MNARIEVKELSYVYSAGMPGETRAVDNVSLEIFDDDFLGIIGPTGSGKSTLVQQFNGLLRPTSGRVLVDGEDIWQDKKALREARFKVGLVFQYPEYQLFEDTVFKDIAYGPNNMGLSEEETEHRVREAARFVGIDEELFSRSPFELSGGQKRRVAIAGVIAMRPEVLILDEPAAGLDPSGKNEILEQIKTYHDSGHGAVVIISHSMEDIAKFCEKVLVLNDGALFCFDKVKEVFSRAKELEELGLAIPAVSAVLLRLKERGFDVDSSAYTPAAAARTISSALGRRPK